MRRELEEEFEEVADNLDQEASSIKCSVGEYVDGLKLIKARLDIILAAAQEDLEAEQGR